MFMFGPVVLEIACDIFIKKVSFHNVIRVKINVTEVTIKEMLLMMEFWQNM